MLNNSKFHSPLKMKSRHTIFIWNQFILVLQSHQIVVNVESVEILAKLLSYHPKVFDFDKCLHIWVICQECAVVTSFIHSTRSLIFPSASFPSHILIMFYSNGIIWKLYLRHHDDTKCFRDVSSLFSHLYPARCSFSGLIQFIFAPCNCGMKKRKKKFSCVEILVFYLDSIIAIV
jgi:hypothetical protein